MRQRILTSLMVLAAALASVLLVTMPVIGQSPAGKTKRRALTHRPSSPGAIRISKACGLRPT